MPIPVMQIDLGYWVDGQGMLIYELKDARTALLRELLLEAGLIGPKVRRESVSPKSLGVLDLGFGGGDQTYELFRQTKPEWGWDKFHYVMLAQNEGQFEAAARAYFREAAERKHLSTQSFRLCPGIGADPGKWEAHVTEVAQSLIDEDLDERWLLAVDGFRFPRAPMLGYAVRELRANLVSFDLIVGHDASWMDMLVVRAVGVLMGLPVKTFLNLTEYMDQLVECGYDPDTISIRDVSECVFYQVSRFTEQQRQASQQAGGMLFECIRRSHVMRAVVVVARIAEGSHQGIPAEEKKDSAWMVNTV